jgi:amino acid adenylation domain-containing protein
MRDGLTPGALDSSEKRKLFELLLKEEGVRVPLRESISRRNEESLPPLSFAQMRLWLLNQLESSSAYNVPVVKRLVGELNYSALQKSLNEIVRRHEALRTTFSAIDGQPRQVIASAAELQLEQLDLSQLAPDEREPEARRLIEADGQRGFDLGQGPLVRALVMKLADEDHVLLIAFHHIIADGWSLGVFFNELAILYGACLRGEQSPLPDLPIQYADYAVWQRDYLQGPVLDRQLKYWKQQLSGAARLLELPTDHLRSSDQSPRGGQESFMLPTDLGQRLQALAQHEGATLFMVLLAAFQMLLSRYCGQEDILVGTPIAGRNRKETETLIGFFVNTLVMRTDLSGSPSFRQLIQRVSKIALEAYAHQDIPFQKLVEEVQPERSLSQQPLIQVFFSMPNMPGPSIEMDGLKLGPFGVRTETTQFDLMLNFFQSTHGISGIFCYRTDLFERETIRALARQFKTLLQSAADSPDKPVKRLPMLNGKQRQRIIHEWNETQGENGEPRCLHELFEEQVERSPEAIAVLHGESAVSYRELNERANRVAHWLIAQGVGPESVVGLLLDHSAALVVSLLGVLKAGAAYLPLEPQQTGERLSFMLEDAGVGVLLTREVLLDELPGYWGQALCVGREWERLAEFSAENPNAVMSEVNLAYVIYTSGSTGQPKGVMIEHRSLRNYVRWAKHEYGLAAGQETPVHSSISFDLTVTSIYGPLLSGGRLVFAAEPDAGATALTSALGRPGTYGLVKLTPAHLEMLRRSLSTMRAGAASHCLVVGGEQLRRETAQWWREQAPQTRLYNEYGPTEATVGCCVLEVEEAEARGAGAVAIGRPIANTRLYILDEEGQPLGVGVRGELYVGGLGLARGYLGRGDLTAERFVPDALSGCAGARLYRTGDLARYRASGVIECLGRADHQVKLRGYRIELGEIEAALGQHSAVTESIVLVKETESGDQRLVAYVVGTSDQQLEANTLRSFLKAKLADYMVPSAFFVLGKLPLTSNGKVDRQTLLALVQTTDTEQGYVAPSTALEESLCGIWKEVLEVERVSVHDNFFDIGGHSLLAAQVLSRITEVFAVEISLRTMFDVPTVSGLTEVLVNQLLEKEGTDNVLSLLDELDELEVVT